MTYEEALQEIAPVYRKQVRDYVERGREPTNEALWHLIIGDFPRAIELNDGDGDLAAVIRFLRCKAPPFCWGSGLRMAKWLYIGGTEGQVQRCA